MDDEAHIIRGGEHLGGMSHPALDYAAAGLPIFPVGDAPSIPSRRVPRGDHGPADNRALVPPPPEAGIAMPTGRAPALGFWTSTSRRSTRKRARSSRAARSRSPPRGALRPVARDPVAAHGRRRTPAPVQVDRRAHPQPGARHRPGARHPGRPRGRLAGRLHRRPAVGHLSGGRYSGKAPSTLAASLSLRSGSCSGHFSGATARPSPSDAASPARRPWRRAARAVARAGRRAPRRGRRRRPARAAPFDCATDSASARRRYALVAIESELADFAGTPPGGQETAMNDAALRIAGLIKGAGLEAEADASTRASSRPAAPSPTNPANAGGPNGISP